MCRLGSSPHTAARTHANFGTEDTRYFMFLMWFRNIHRTSHTRITVPSRETVLNAVAVFKRTLV